MSDLTEQWRKGELESGSYYIEYLDGSNHRFTKDYYDEEFECFDNYQYRGIKEVLAPVPSYEEWQELSKQRNQLIRDVKDLAYIQEENQKLKELLKECREVIEWYKGDCGYKDVPTESVLTKIDEVLK